MSRAVRLQAVLDTAKKFGWDPGDGLAECYTCGKIITARYGDAGHFKSRDIGGSSGLYFDERAVRFQCKQCNGYRQGAPQEFREGLVKEYGEDTVQELERLQKLPSRWRPKDYPALTEYWKAETLRLMDETGVRKWWR